FFILPFFFFRQPIDHKALWLSFLIFYIFVLLEIRNHLEDYEFDKKAGLKTTVCFLGKERSKGLVFFLIILFPLFLFPLFFEKKNFFIFYLLSSLVFLFFFWKKENYRIFDFFVLFNFFLLLLM
ncbi:MAG: UbiA family prenyltransferase, partial [Minisyncoccales bacterium]